MDPLHWGRVTQHDEEETLDTPPYLLVVLAARTASANTLADILSFLIAHMLWLQVSYVL